MRKIDKTIPLQEFVDFVHRNNPRDWDKDIPAELKQKVREYILREEQCGWSAYTERKLDMADVSLHVDHLVKQQFCKYRQVFEWTNLFVDEHAGAEQYGADFKDNSKNRVVKSWNDCMKIINPAREDPHDYFAYAANGEMMVKPGIEGTECEKADFTIRAFNLNGQLVYQRREVLRAIASYKLAEFSAEDTKAGLMDVSSFPSLIEYFCCPAIWECIDTKLAY